MTTPKNILGMDIRSWKDKYPLLSILLKKKVVFWFNPKLARYEFIKDNVSVSTTQLQDVENRWLRFAPLFQHLYPETLQFEGRIQSHLKPIPKIQTKLKKFGKKSLHGNFYAKLDNELSVAGSIKARGGIYEVICIADGLLREKWQFTDNSSCLQITESKFQAFFHQYTISVGSTGNLGLSIGLIAQKLGFQTQIYMSNDAKQWKKEKLRSNGVKIVEIDGDYTKAVKVGRETAEEDPMVFFIDDEQSYDLFYGYAVAAFELKSQMDAQNIPVDQDHPLFLYLPCGVGTSPGGITYGLKTIFGDHVHCFFVEPVACPSMLLGLLTQKHHEISIEDFGISAHTEADGLACARPSKFVGKIMESLVSGIYTVDDDDLFGLLAMLWDSEQIQIEPSSAGPLLGPLHLMAAEEYSHYIRDHNLTNAMEQSTHVLWFTGGKFLPKEIWDANYTRGTHNQLYRDLT